MSRAFKWSLLVLLCVVGLGLAWPTFETVSIQAPMLGIPLIITRNGQEIPAEQIRSVKYQVLLGPAKAPVEVRDADLREANRNDHCYLIAASFSRYHYSNLFERDEVKPKFHSVLLRIAFADGKVISLSYPVVSDTRENTGLYVDLGEDSKSFKTAFPSFPSGT